MRKPASAFRSPRAIRAIYIFLAIASFGCRREKNDAADKPVDAVPKIPSAGPLVLLPSAQLRSGKDVRIAPWLVDPESGAAHRLIDVDPSCTSLVRFAPDKDGAKQLYSIDGVAAWSSKSGALFAAPGASDVPLVRMPIEGACTPLWHETYEWMAGTSVAPDASLVARRRSGAIELRGTDGGAPRMLEWTRGLAIDDLALSPNGDRLALAKQATSDASKPFDVVTCDLAGACKTVFSSTGRCVELQWSIDGARVACVTLHPDDSDAIVIGEVAHPERAPLSIVHAVKKTRYEHPGHLTHFGFSPDGLRVVLVSSHEAGCTAYVRDMGSTCEEAIYVASAEREGPLRLVRSGLESTARPWWIR